MGAKFLTNIRDVDVVLHVVRCFDNDDVIHIHSKVDPLDDMACVEEELMLADLATIEKRIENAKKKVSPHTDSNPTTSFAPLVDRCFTDLVRSLCCSCAASRPKRLLRMQTCVSVCSIVATQR